MSNKEYPERIDKRKFLRILTNIPVFIKPIKNAREFPLTILSNKNAVIKDISQGGMLIVYEEKTTFLRKAPKIEKYILEEIPIEINIRLDSENIKLSINIEVLPLWAKFRTYKESSILKVGICFLMDILVKPVTLENSTGLLFDMTQKSAQNVKRDLYVSQKIQKPVKRTLGLIEQAAKHYYRGVFYDSIGEYTMATEEFKQAIELGYENAEIHNKLGKIYLRHNNKDLAISEFKEALEIDPFHIQAKYNSLSIKNKND